MGVGRVHADRLREHRRNEFPAEFLISVHGFSLELAGATFALLYGVGIVVKPIAGLLSDHVPRLAVVGGAMAIASVSLGLLVVAGSTVVAVVAVVGYALGQRSFPPPLQAHLLDRFPDENKGGDLGAMRAVYMSIGSLGPSYVGFVASEGSYTAAFASIAVCFLGAAVIVLWLTSFE